MVDLNIRLTMINWSTMNLMVNGSWLIQWPAPQEDLSFGFAHFAEVSSAEAAVRAGAAPGGQPSWWEGGQRAGDHGWWCPGDYDFQWFFSTFLMIFPWFFHDFQWFSMIFKWFCTFQAAWILSVRLRAGGVQVCHRHVEIREAKADEKDWWVFQWRRCGLLMGNWNI